MALYQSGVYLCLNDISHDSFYSIIFRGKGGFPQIIKGGWITISSCTLIWGFHCRVAHIISQCLFRVPTHRRSCCKTHFFIMFGPVLDEVAAGTAQLTNCSDIERQRLLQLVLYRRMCVFLHIRARYLCPTELF